MAKASKITATAMIGGQKVTHDVGSLGQIKLAGKPKIIVRLEPSDSAKVDPQKPFELVIKPGTTVSAKVIVERNGFKGRISFGNEDSGRNLPHGIFVDNIGLNGLLIVEGKSEREFFITAAKWVPKMTRVFHVRATAEGGQTSQPVVLRVE